LRLQGGFASKGWPPAPAPGASKPPRPLRTSWLAGDQPAPPPPCAPPAWKQPEAACRPPLSLGPFRHNQKALRRGPPRPADACCAHLRLFRLHPAPWRLEGAGACEGRSACAQHLGCPGFRGSGPELHICIYKQLKVEGFAQPRPSVETPARVGQNLPGGRPPGWRHLLLPNLGALPTACCLPPPASLLLTSMTALP